MITKKRFSSVDGVTSRFLSDFIIQSEQFARVYVYFYNPAGVEGAIDPGTGLPTRVADFPNPAEDLINLDKWDLVDNSILFYTEPVAGSSVYLEVATTPEEFGDTLTAPAVERAEVAATEAEASAAAALVSETNAALSETNAGLSEAAALVSETNAGLSEAAAALSETNAGLSAASASADAAQTALDRIATNADVVTSGVNATNAQLSEWEAEAERLTADSYATEAEDTFVNLVTSDGDGTFTYTPTTEYSALHWAAKAATFNPSLYLLLTGGKLSGSLFLENTIGIRGYEADGVTSRGLMEIDATDTAQIGATSIPNTARGDWNFLNSAPSSSISATLASHLTRKDYVDGSNTLTATGSKTMPGGLIIKWGTFSNTGTSGSGTITFPVAFPNGCFHANCIDGVSTTTIADIGVTGLTASQVTYYWSGAELGAAYYFAIGY